MTKIAILTEYYKSYNYGGVLQAYSLCKVIEKLGYDCEQIQYKKNKDSMSFCLNNVIKYIPNIMKKTIMKLVYYKRTKYFDNFRNEKIRHSKDVYTDLEMHQIVDEYDVFVVGSDQVWNPNLFNKSYFLEFVPGNKVKISYAASLSVFELTDNQKQFFSKCLNDYTAISVREKNAIDLLKQLTDIKIECVLDPTLLLTKNEWEELMSDRTIDEKYIFVYFLGSNQLIKKLVEDYAKIKKLKIVYMPLVFGWKSGFDKGFGDIRLFDVSPEDFISLIRNAEIVFTDSFHAVVFSHIFKTNFFAFKRLDHPSMASRLYNITELFNTQNHFCDDYNKMTLDYLLDNEKLDIDSKIYDEYKKISIDFLINNLSKNKGDCVYEK